MKKFEIAFLISTKSGTGKGVMVWNRLPAILADIGLSPADYRLQPIATHDVMMQAADLSRKSERLIVAGGDGTAAAAIAGVHAGGKTIPVGVIPVGTGNDLGRVTGMHETLRKSGLHACVMNCLEGVPVPLDIWRVNQSHFMVNYLSIGMDAAAVNSFSHYRGKISQPHPSLLINRCLYLMFGLHHVFIGVKGMTTIHSAANGRRETYRLSGLRTLIISNIPSYAGGTLPSPEADFADNHLDITTFKSIHRFAGLFLVQPCRGLRKWYGKMLNHYRCKNIELCFPPGNFLQIDGEDRTYLLEQTGTISLEHAGQGMVICRNR